MKKCIQLHCAKTDHILCNIYLEGGLKNEHHKQRNITYMDM